MTLGKVMSLGTRTVSKHCQRATNAHVRVRIFLKRAKTTRDSFSGNKSRVLGKKNAQQMDGRTDQKVIHIIIFVDDNKRMIDD